MAVSALEREPADCQRWACWSMLALERLPLPYGWLVVIAALWGLGEQVYEIAQDHPGLRGVPADTVLSALVFPVLMVYILVNLRALKMGGIRALAELRRSVRVDDDAYDALVKRMVCADWRTELALLAVSAAMVVLLFVGLGAGLLSSANGLPASPPGAVFVSVTYVFLGWLLLSLLYSGTRHALALKDMARHPLEINVYDPANLLPFGRLSLLYSLPSVGIVLIPLIFFGPPTQAGYLVVLVSLMGLVTLFIPLMGVHKQIDDAKDAVLVSMHEQLADIQGALLGGDATTDDLDDLAKRTSTMVHLRKMVQESPSWPFKDAAATVRSIVAVMSPLIYFVLTELTRVYILPLLGS